jgi:hypothetical protein
MVASLFFGGGLMGLFHQPFRRCTRGKGASAMRAVFLHRLKGSCNPTCRSLVKERAGLAEVGNEEAIWSKC